MSRKHKPRVERNKLLETKKYKKMKQTQTEGILEIKIFRVHIGTGEARFPERIQRWKTNLKH